MIACAAGTTCSRTSFKKRLAVEQKHTSRIPFLQETQHTCMHVGDTRAQTNESTQSNIAYSNCKVYQFFVARRPQLRPLNPRKHKLSTYSRKSFELHKPRPPREPGDTEPRSSRATTSYMELNERQRRPGAGKGRDGQKGSAGRHHPMQSWEADAPR